MAGRPPSASPGPYLYSPDGYEESTSFTSAAQIIGEEDGLPLRLSFNYLNRPKTAARERCQMHDGAAVLRIAERPERVLEGQYWTDRKTTGDLQVLFRSNEETDHFSMWKENQSGRG